MRVVGPSSSETPKSATLGSPTLAFFALPKRGVLQMGVLHVLW